MDSDSANNLWHLFNQIGKGWHISSGSQCICFDPNDPNDMKDSFSFLRTQFDNLKDLGLVEPAEEKDFNSKETKAESLGYIFTVSDKGKAWFTDIGNLDESGRESKFYELADIQVL